jgi:perosamine synthetase
MDSPFIPVSKPSITQLEIDYVNDAVKSTWISSLGKYIDRLEEEFAAFCECKYAVSLSNGTVAIHLALIANGISPGDEVIVPDLSFIATANAVLHAGARPVFIDIDPESLCMDPALIEKSITKNTKAIMPVHLYGHAADMHAINDVAARHNLLVIEDAAEAHGARFKMKRVGGLGNCATFSFYGNKNITTGEGGMITTNDKELHDKCKYLRDHAMSKEKRYWHTEPGYNYRMTNIQAALGCAQMTRINSFLEKRKQIFNWYSTELNDVEEVSLNRTSVDVENTYWLICAEIRGIDYEERENIMARMKSKGIDTRPYFYPMSHMPYFEKADTPVAVAKSKCGISLPTFTDITLDEIKRVAKALKESI